MSKDRLIELLRASLFKHKIVVTGSSGWLGKNLIDLLMDVYQDDFELSVMPLANTKREVALLNGRKFTSEIFDINAVIEFNPTFVIHLAFLTREKLEEQDQNLYLNENLKIINQVKEITRLPSVKLILNTSSGAARDSFDLYGTLKRFEESELEFSAQKNNKSMLIVRTWSVSGNYIKLGGHLALEEFIDLAKSNSEINIKNPIVWRTYIDSYEMFGVSILGLLNGRYGLINSGGYACQIIELANVVKRELDSNSSITIAPLTIQKPSYYTSPFPKLNQIADDFGLNLSCLDQQIAKTINYLNFT